MRWTPVPVESLSQTLLVLWQKQVGRKMLLYISDSPATVAHLALEAAW
jgi:hypothetical protein